MAAEHAERVGARIARRREELGLTQRELADRIPGKTDSNQISKWERGKHRPTDDALDAIAKALETEASYFLVPEPAKGGPGDLLGVLSGDRATGDPAPLEQRVDALLQALSSVAMGLQVESKSKVANDFYEDALVTLADHLPGSDDPAGDALSHAERERGGQNGTRRRADQA